MPCKSQERICSTNSRANQKVENKKPQFALITQIDFSVLSVTSVVIFLCGDYFMPVFYAVSTGPGGAELITLKALRILKSCDIIFYPESKKNSIALNSLKNLESEIDLSHKSLFPCNFSMTEDEKKSESEYKIIAEHCLDFLKNGKDVAMLSIGDVSLYSTAGKTASLIKKAGFKVEFVAGVNSFSAAASSASLSLCEKDQALSVIPGDSFFNDGKLESELKNAGSKILMKMGRHLKEIILLLEKLDLIKKSVLVQKASLADEKIFYGEQIFSICQGILIMHIFQYCL